MRFYRANVEIKTERKTGDVSLNPHGWIGKEEGEAKPLSRQGFMKKNSAGYVESACQLKEDVGLTSG